MAFQGGKSLKIDTPKPSDDTIVRASPQQEEPGLQRYWKTLHKPFSEAGQFCPCLDPKLTTAIYKGEKEIIIF